ncbi:MAG: glycine cleavage system protein GcvH [Chloroflexota bacterium]|nr:MAG: glycine cleavage system protein GcvH [Chloroflexota bacterium]UCF27773.1 MAG: glycine cleavage system protein GcvH [Chloroflexota bacterium]
MNIPADLKYSENDEWIRIEGNTGTVGITDFAQDQLSDVVFVEIIAEQDEELNQGDACATVESVKAAADVYLPVGGTITEINEDLLDTPELVNTDPYGEAWMVKIELSDPSQADGLLDADAYQKHCEVRLA